MARAPGPRPKRSAAKKQRPKRIRKRQAGLPEPTSVVSETTLVSPRGATYRVLTTTEKDPYETRPKKRKS